MFTVNNNTGSTLTLYDKENTLATINNGVNGTQVNSLTVTSVDCGGVIYATHTGSFVNGETYTATFVAKSVTFPHNNVLFSNGKLAGNVRYS
jgi:hypothetical protein